MENNCFILKLKDSVQGDYDKLNFLKVKVCDRETVIFSPDKRADIIIKAEDCTFTQSYYQIIDATEYTFTQMREYTYLDLKIKGNGYLYVSNKYDLGYYQLYNVDLDKIYSQDKAIKYFIVLSSNNTYVKGNINHLLSQCSPNLKQLKLYSIGSNVTGDITEINKFTNLTGLALVGKTFIGDISIFSSLVNLTDFTIYGSNLTGNLEDLAQAWYNNGKTTGTVQFQANNTSIIAPSIITNVDQFYCTFTEEGYTFSQTNPNT